jgi:acyl-CoA thioester hydrolase
MARPFYPETWSGQTERVDLTDRGTYGHWSRDKVRWRDQDGSRHINNVAYAEYLENARTELIIDRLIVHKAKGHNFIVRRVAIDYLGEGSYPGKVEIGSTVVDVGESSFTVGQGVFMDGRCLATGETVHIHHLKGERVPLTDDLRAALEGERPG